MKLTTCAAIAAFGVLVMCTTGPIYCQDVAEATPGLTSASMVTGDVLVYWRAGAGATITYRGVPLFAGNPSEFVAHQKWQKVLYRSQSDGARAVVDTSDPDRSVMTIREQAERFAFEKRIIVAKSGDIRLEYEYGILGDEAAEVQVLFGIGRPWFHQSKYRLIVNGEERTGELSAPDKGRIDPWGGATEQVFNTEYGELSIRSEKPMNLLCEPGSGALWWFQPLDPEATYTQAIDVSIKPGPACDTGLALSGIEWTDRVRAGEATFNLKLAKTEGGPDQVIAYVEPASGNKDARGPSVEASLSETPVDVQCTADVPRKGHNAFALVIAQAEDGKELLRLQPLMVESAPFLQVMPRLSLYTGEAQAEVVVDLAEDVDPDTVSVALAGEGMAQAEHKLTGQRTLVPVELAGMAMGATTITCTLLRDGERLASSVATLRKAPPKPNEVKVDNVSRGLIADGLPFVPFGYYTYYPLAPGVMDEEVVRGFNLFSPYHGGPHSAEDLEPIREYMDHCAEVGMKVNYHVMWTNRPSLDEEQWASLRAEIEAFRDHPALLSWYIADEPSADRAAHLSEVYRVVKELDPYHPVTVVFYRGAEHARLFTDAMDIVMGDPYPIPNRSVTYVSEMSDSLNSAFDFRKNLWIVPQAFGGNEHWRREPTAGEQQVMTYLALIHGARGIQYFIRSPRISFPKSPIMWAKCGQLALETAELTPALLSPEPRPEVASSVPAVHACGLLDRGIITVLATNTENKPHIVRLQVDGIDYTGEAEVLFEDRRVQVTEGAIEEPIDAFGRRAYAIPVGPLPEEDLSIDPGNRTVNPSWENNPNVGTPAGCYASVGPGASLTVDSRVARHGRHSMRMTATAQDPRCSISPFPMSLKGGQEYRVSVWAKAKADGVLLDLNLGGLHKEQHALTTEWVEYSFTATPEKNVGRASPGIGLGSPGVAWVDLLQVAPVEDVEE